MKVSQWCTGNRIWKSLFWDIVVLQPLMALSLTGDAQANSFPAILSEANGPSNCSFHWLLMTGCSREGPLGAGCCLVAEFLGERKPWKTHCNKSLVRGKQKVKLYHKFFIFLHNPTLRLCSGESKRRLSDKIIVKRSEIKIYINAYVK